jgi:putative endonuclease
MTRATLVMRRLFMSVDSLPQTMFVSPQHGGNMQYGGYTYILTNSKNTVLYVGVTADLAKRIHQHKLRLVPGFTAKYWIQKLVYYEQYESIVDAIAREKHIKSKTRAKKIALVTTMNPGWQDLMLK